MANTINENKRVSTVQQQQQQKSRMISVTQQCIQYPTLKMLHAIFNFFFLSVFFFFNQLVMYNRHRFRAMFGKPV